MVGALSRGLLLIVAFAVVLPASARGSAIGAFSPHREDVDQTQYPWTAIGKVTNETGGSCSGVMIASDKVLTAAHCLYNYRGRRFIGADAMHFLLGYRAGTYTAHARVSRYAIGPGFNPERYEQTFDSDWAVLTLTAALPSNVTPLELIDEVIPSGTKAMLAGYAQDRAQALTADRDCELRDRIDQGRLMLHTCRSANGVSGAPILVRTATGRVQIAGIQVAMQRRAGTERMLAVPAQMVARQAVGTVVAEVMYPGDPIEPECAGGNEQVAALDSIRDRFGLLPTQAQTGEIQLSDLAAHGPAKPTAMAWVMEDRFIFAVE